MDALMVNNGAIIEEGYTGRYSVPNDEALRVCLNAMTKMDINETLDHLGMTTMPMSAKKSVMINSFFHAWNAIQEGAHMTRDAQVAVATLVQGKGDGKGVASASSDVPLTGTTPFSGQGYKLNSEGDETAIETYDIEDFIDDTDCVNELPQSYLNDPADFDEYTLFHIYDPHDTKKLMTIPVSDLSESVADLKEFIVAKICEFVNKKDKKTMSRAMMVGDFRLQRYGYYLRNDGTLAGVAGGDTEVRINLVLTLKGGGKRARIVERDELVMFAPLVLPTDIEAVKDALKLTSINLEAWVKSLGADDLVKLVKGLDDTPRSGVLSAQIAPCLPFIREYQNLTVSWKFF